MSLSRPTSAAATPARATATDLVLRARGIVKRFPIAGEQLEVLHGVDLELARGERLALVGSSGAGKSTLLHVLGLLERPTLGVVEIDGASAWTLSIGERGALRNQKIGFVFQFYHLLSELNAFENALLPAMIAHSRFSFQANKRQLEDRARELLVRFGLEKRLRHRPAQLSGGERQRVALARALFHRPPIVIADEPTGNLDSATGELVLELLFREQRESNLSLLLVTHDASLAARCDRQVHMHDGRML